MKAAAERLQQLSRDYEKRQGELLAQASGSPPGGAWGHMRRQGPVCVWRHRAPPHPQRP